DPSVGRFLSEDSIGFAGGVNFYAYTANSPTGPRGRRRMVVLKHWIEKENLKLAAFFTLFVICFVGGCRHDFTSADLAGTYIASWSFGKEELLLASNGTYTQTFTPADKSLKVASASGKWTIDHDEVRLFDSLLIHDHYGDLSSSYAEKKS